MPGTGHRRVGERREVRGEERCGGSLLFVESGGGEAGGETLGTGVGRRATELLPITRDNKSKRSATRWMEQEMEDGEARRKREGKSNALDTEKSVVLRDTLRTGRGAGLDLAGTEGDDEVGDDGVLSLAGTVGDHDTPAVGLRELSSLDGLGDRTDLVDLEGR